MINLNHKQNKEPHWVSLLINRNTEFNILIELIEH